jgi:HPr kinase/phosphorylase
MPTDKQNLRKISVAEFVENAPAELAPEVLAGKKGLKEREITSARIQKLGLALAGFSRYIHPGRVQIVGQSEISFLVQQESRQRAEVLKNLDLAHICCVLLTKNLEPPAELLEIADETALPVLRTKLVSSAAIGAVSDFLLEELAPQTTVHGVLMEMYGLGVLLLGKSGVGKSECALDLISRGHRLISDDSVILKKKAEQLEGGSPELSASFLEIRGLGIINIRDLFGVSAVGKKKQIDLCVELKNWNEVVNVERLGIDTDEREIFGVKIPKFVLPVSPGRNLSILVETAVRVFLLRISGFNSAQALMEKHSAVLNEKK